MSKSTSNQVGNNKTGKGGFGDNPQNINRSGHWKKEDTPRFKLETMMTMTEEELRTIVEDKNQPLFERNIALAIKGSDWKTIESMINQVYGVPKSEIDMKVGADDGSPLIKGFVIPTLPDNFVKMDDTTED